MVIDKLVSIPDQEVRIDVCLEDITLALAEEQRNSVTQWVYAVRTALNDTAKFLKAITGDHIEALGPDSRRLVRLFLTEQAKRYEEK
jgi:hypothetical protein